jgi:NAD(P)-dependent dehydrogenase (short-subunit alcohol dehydrogenase family)
MINYGEGGVAVVTGAAGGIGLGMCRAAAARGMAVMMSDVDAERLGAAAQTLIDDGIRVAMRAVDVTDPAALEALAKATVEEFGRVDLVCNNAGITLVTPIHELSLDDWHRVIDIDLNAVFYGVRSFLPIMLEQGFGHLNATASANAWRSDPMQAPYNVAKHGVAALMESVALDLRETESPVTASVLSPGPIATDLMLRSLGDDDEMRSEVHGLLNEGMNPDKVGQITLDAIVEGRFWIFTHPLIFGTIRDRLEAAIADGSLPPELDWPWEELFASS